MAKLILTQEIVSALLEYDPKTGGLFWKARGREWFTLTGHGSSGVPDTWNKKWAGKPAFRYVNKDLGYKSGRIFNRGYQAHRIIWLLVYGEWPLEIDHINHNRMDNSLNNLRNVTPQENRRNASLPRDNSSGSIGVSLNKNKKKWRARIGVDGKEIVLGEFENKIDAIAARKAAEIKYGFHPNHGT